MRVGHLAVTRAGKNYAVGAQHPREGDRRVDVGLRADIGPDHDRDNTDTVGLGPALSPIEI